MGSECSWEESQQPCVARGLGRSLLCHASHQRLM